MMEDPQQLHQNREQQERWPSARRAAAVRTTAACPREVGPINGGNGDDGNDDDDVGQQQPRPQHGDSASSSSPQRRPPPPPPSIRRRKRRRRYWIGASAVAISIIILPVLYVDFATLDRVFLPSEVHYSKKRVGGQTTTMTLLEPVAVLHQYIEWHSHDSLVAEQPDSSHHPRRAYAVAYYSCPHRVGNFLHNFFNAAIWAVIYNRTLLWKFDGPPQQEEDCHQQVLRRAPWMPSYDAWATRLALPEPPTAVRMNTRRTPKNQFFTRQEQLDSLSPARNPIAIFPQIPDVARSNRNISRVSWWEDPRRLTRPTVIRNTAAHFGRTVHLDNPWVSRRTLQSLYAEGLYFLYGMLFREMFEIRNVPPPLSQSSSTPSSQEEEEEGEVSIALHSRHAVLADDGSNVDGEIQCLEQILRANPNNNHNNNDDEAAAAAQNSSSCAVYLMSDRPATLEGVREWLLQQPPQPHHHGHRCRVVTVPHNASSRKTGTKGEHGPFAGAGFLWDLAAASRARTAVVGDFSRSSTALLLDLIVYDRKMEQWRKTKKMTTTNTTNAAAAAADGGGRATMTEEDGVPIKDLQLCKLPDRPES